VGGSWRYKKKKILLLLFDPLYGEENWQRRRGASVRWGQCTFEHVPRSLPLYPQKQQKPLSFGGLCCQLDFTTELFHLVVDNARERSSTIRQQFASSIVFAFCHSCLSHSLWSMPALSLTVMSFRDWRQRSIALVGLFLMCFSHIYLSNS